MNKVSQLGEYQGYTKEEYHGYKRVSQYIKVRDGTKLAADIFFPTKDKKQETKPLPVIWSHIRYHRATIDENNNITTRIDMPLLRKLLNHGYIIAAVDTRGAGASYGTRKGELLSEEATDGYDVTEWLAEQPWCNGKIGMYGLSYMGITQYMAAGTAPPHLKAIIPEMAMFDLYSFRNPGGVGKEGFYKEWGKHTLSLDKKTRPVPVDEDKDGTMLREAVKQHQNNLNILDYSSELKYRDSTLLDENQYHTRSPSSYIDGINKSSAAVYHIAGWYDMYPRDQLLWFNNLKVPQRLLMTPWSHTTGWRYTPSWHEMITPLIGYEPDYNEILDFHWAEMIRWYDYWLKDIDNGIMNEPPINYYTIGAQKEEAWRTSNQWPIPSASNIPYYLQVGPSGSIKSVNDGKLNKLEPREESGYDEYITDETTTSGRETRWTNGYGAPIKYPDMRKNDLKALTYTTEPLEQDIEITGHPIIHIWVTAPSKVDFYAYLEEVDESGYSHYLTEGVLRVSHRALSEPPFENISLPYHRSYKEDMLPTSKEPMELVFDLLPISNIFEKGHRLRVAVTCADRINYESIDYNEKIRVHRNSTLTSYILLPIVQK